MSEEVDYKALFEAERTAKEAAERRAEEADQRAKKAEQTGRSAHEDEGRGKDTNAVVPARRVRYFFDIGTVVAGMTFTTTQKMLGVQSLSVHAKKDSIMISSSEKACTFRYRGQGKDLAWRQIDIYGLPKHYSEYSLDVLADMTTREIEAYVHLRSVWGELVPHFVYFGNDFAMLWAFVTTYEGVSLRTIEKESGGLTQSTKNEARSALAQLHALGVIHGQAVPRNVLRRETDGRIIWIDFESSTLLQDIDKNEFTRLAERELLAFESELASILTLPEAVVDASVKRIKVLSCDDN
jgi:tRNA A-37 threonylcarbamoyl transferase component Bud32